MTFFRKLSWWLHRRRREAELREELEFHIDEEADARQAEGLPSDQARLAARRDLGNVTLLREETRTLWSWMLLEQFAQDIRFAFRSMLKNRMFTALAALSLALGIGANTAIYSFMDAILIRSLPVSDPASLAVIKWRARPVELGHGPESLPRSSCAEVRPGRRRRVGTHFRDLSVPRVRTPATVLIVRVLAHLCLPARGTHQRLDQGRGGAGRRRVRDRRLLPRPLRVACSRADDRD